MNSYSEAVSQIKLVEARLAAVSGKSDIIKQAKDIPAIPILRFLGGLGTNWGVLGNGNHNSIENAMPSSVPRKLVLAKMRQLIKRGLVSGCTCGCRGEFELTDKGRSILGAGQ